MERCDYMHGDARDVTVSEALLPRLDEALNTGRMPELLPVGGSIQLPAAR